MLDTALVTERKELERYSEIVRKELRIKEYMYVVVEIGTDTAPLNERYTEQCLSGHNRKAVRAHADANPVPGAGAPGC